MLIQLTIQSLAITFLLGICQWLSARWISARLEKSIQHEYDKKIEKYRFQQLQREKAEVIARLFSKWIKYSGKEGDYLSGQELIDYQEELNRMSLAISLWINDGKLLSDISSQLQHKDYSKDIRTLTGEIRKLILGDSAMGDFNPQEITLWLTTDEILSKIPTSRNTE